MSWRQEFNMFFIEPGIGLGGAIGQLRLKSDTQTYEKWDANFAARAFFNVGFQVPGGMFGFQGSYMHGGHLEFGQNVKGDVNEFYIGIFGSLVF